MIKVHYIYRPSCRDYLQYFDNSSSHGPHMVWTDLPYARPFDNQRKAYELAETISQADRLKTQVITLKELGRSTIE